MSTRIKFTVNDQYDNRLVKEFLRRECDVSSSLLTKLKQTENGITCRGEHIRAVDILKTGDEIVIELPDDENDIIPVKLPIKILYEDEHIIVFDKDAFMAVHPVHGHIDDTLANAAAYYAKLHGEVWTFRAINRLDRDTTGVLLAAKNSYAAAKLPKSVKKKYVAVCEGILSSSGTVDKAIRIKEGHSIQREVGEGGVRAVTHYKPIMWGRNHTLVEFELETGRTHQIRVHMSYLGYPLAGDDMYGGSLSFINRQALHCAQVSFLHPISGEVLKICSDLPRDFWKLIGLDENGSSRIISAGE